MSDKQHKSARKQAGFSLLEVLISMVVLAIGLLGLGGLQVATLKGANSAHSRTVATMYATELADRMRANPLGVSGGFYSAETLSCSSVTACRRSTYCTPQQVASFDLQEIMCGMKRALKMEGGVKNQLVNGTLSVTCPAGCASNKAVHNIRITWGETAVHRSQVNNSSTKSLLVSVTP